MREVGIRALKQNASAVVQAAAAGERIVVTDRGRPVAQILPLGEGRLASLSRAGLLRHRRHRLSTIGPPPAVPVALSRMVIAARDDERY
jgi:prevent-host-death family protein